MRKVIVSLAGNPNAGKTDLARHLETKRGFTIVRPSDLIQQHALLTTGIALTRREDFATTLQQMFEAYGPYYLANQALNIPNSKICVDGERIPSQIEKLRQHGALVIALWAPIESRHQRAIERGNPRDHHDFAAFAADEAREYQMAEPPYMSTLTVMQEADHHIDAARPQEQVFTEVDGIVDSILSKMH